MNAVLEHLGISLRLHFRNRMALLYGYLFPLIFLVAFWVLYRHEKIPLLRHMGELLTVSVLGGACFGLPTTLVSERERGVWRLYRLTPLPTWSIIMSTALARYVIVLTAGLLQLGAALAIGMTAPAHPLALWVAFTAVSFAFIGLGLVIATLADNVPAVQALGQCLFLPMLIIGGVAVQLASLPVWAQHVSAFFPGRYAVEALQAAVTGTGFSGARFSLLALTLIGGAGCVAGARLFRWDAQQRFAVRTGKLWLVAVFGAWLAVGLLAEARGRIAIAVDTEVPAAAPAAPPVALTPSPSMTKIAPAGAPGAVPPAPLTTAPAPVPQPAWTRMTQQDTDALDFNVPPDDGIVAPFANTDEDLDEFVKGRVEAVRRGLREWSGDHETDEVQRVRNLLCVAAVPDTIQLPVERYIPPVVFARLREIYAPEKLVKILTWIVLHPDEGTVVTSIEDLGVEGEAGDSVQLRERASFYALKFLIRLTGRKPQ